MAKNANELVKKATCSQCGGARNCDIRGQYEQRGSDDFFYWSTEWYLLQCRGCDYVFLQTVSSDSESYDQDYDENGDTITEYIKREQYWPALAKRERPEWMSDAGINSNAGAGTENAERLDSSLLELYKALDNDLNILSAIGIRTTFDVASELLEINPHLTFSKKLDALVSAGHIEIADKANLGVLVDAGNASTHRGWRPSTAHLNTMMDILEQFIHDVFIKPERQKRKQAQVMRMKEHVPQKKMRQKKNLSK